MNYICLTGWFQMVARAKWLTIQSLFLFWPSFKNQKQFCHTFVIHTLVISGFLCDNYSTSNFCNQKKNLITPYDHLNTHTSSLHCWPTLYRSRTVAVLHIFKTFIFNYVQTSIYAANSTNKFCFHFRKRIWKYPNRNNPLN